MRKLPPEIYRWKIMNMMQNGVPDCYFSGSAGDLWVEVKYVKAPKRETTLIKIDLSDLQRKWLTDRHTEGRNVALLVGSSLGCWLENCPPFDEPLNRNSFTVSREQVVQWIIRQTLG